MGGYVIDIDDLYPRDAEHRFRIYGCRGDSLDVVAVASDLASVGVAIGQIHEDMRSVGGDLGDLGAFGLLDAVAGEWLIKPFPRGNHV